MRAIFATARERSCHAGEANRAHRIEEGWHDNYCRAVESEIGRRTTTAPTRVRRRPCCKWSDRATYQYFLTDIGRRRRQEQNLRRQYVCSASPCRYLYRLAC